jgi:hypothetical protein
MPSLLAEYDQNVFINCPFDDEYRAIFHALVFAIFECGLRPRCALEVQDAGDVRIVKIERIIRDCRWGIHDISRTETNPRGLPRFNMPLELRIFLGARHFGDKHQKRKSCLILDVERYRYQEYISDIAGQDIKLHKGETRLAIKAVRDWLGESHAGLHPAPGVAAIFKRFERFLVDLPAICAATDREIDDLTFTELADATSTWLRTALTRP